MDRLFLFLIKFIHGKEVLDMLAMLYATLILKGKKTIEDVPAKLREKVEEILADAE